MNHKSSLSMSQIQKRFCFEWIFTHICETERDFFSHALMWYAIPLFFIHVVYGMCKCESSEINCLVVVILLLPVCVVSEKLMR